MGTPNKKRAAWARALFVRELTPRLLCFARHLISKDLNGFLDARDVVQDTYVRALEKIDAFEGRTPEDFYSWLESILRLEARNHRRYATTQKRSLKRMDRSFQGELGRLDEIPARDTETEDLLVSMERSQVILYALSQLPPSGYRVFYLRCLEGLAAKEVGRRLGMKPASVSKTLLRARKRLRELVEEHPEFKEETE